MATLSSTTLFAGICFFNNLTTGLQSADIPGRADHYPPLPLPLRHGLPTTFWKDKQKKIPLG
jgi:hypothetical protein